MIINCKHKEIYLCYLSQYEFLIGLRNEKYSLETCTEVKMQTLYDVSTVLKFKDIQRCFKSLGFLLDMLERNRKMFFKIDIQDIYVFTHDDKYHFLITNFEDVLEMDEKDEIYIMCPFTKSLFISDKLKYVDELPISISYKSVYYNLGIIIYWLLFGLDEFDISKMEEYKNTKLYYCFMRCINENLEQRNFIWI